jgi:hypothetical protein
VFIDTIPGSPRRLTLDLAGTIETAGGYDLALHSPPTVRPTPLEATISLVGPSDVIVAEGTLTTDIGTARTSIEAR